MFVGVVLFCVCVVSGLVGGDVGRGWRGLGEGGGLGVAEGGLGGR